MMAIRARLMFAVVLVALRSLSWRCSLQPAQRGRIHG
jgi:hypothetical protein